MKKLLGIKSETNINGNNNNNSSGLNGDIKPTNESKRYKRIEFEYSKNRFDRLESFRILLKMRQMI